jgi:hypothetical protein
VYKNVYKSRVIGISMNMVRDYDQVALITISPIAYSTKACMHQIIKPEIIPMNMKVEFGRGHGNCHECTRSDENKHCWGYTPVDLPVRTFYVSERVEEFAAA